jgi:hypothetical protein
MSAASLMQRRRQEQRKRAFADATAGVIGSLAAMLAFYPVDVWKTSLQANATITRRANKQCRDDEDDDAAAPASNNLLAVNSNDVSIVTSTPLPSMVASISKTVLRLFRGLPYKIAHTIASSFTYWYVYSLLQTKYAAYQLNHHRLSQSNRTTIEPSSTSTSSKNSSSSVVAKLILTAIAAMVNTGITLPLDTISSRRQVALASMKDGDGDGESMNNNKQQLHAILCLWNGLLPALMLCTNPAIQYTLYDAFKAAWLVRRRYKVHSSQQQSLQPSSSAAASSNNPTRRRQHSLSMSEAFACGMISKFIATMITYPLIRCKVMLMVSTPHHATTTTTTTTITTAASSAFASSKEISNLSTGSNEMGAVLEKGNNQIICNGSHDVQRGETEEATIISSSSSSSPKSSSKAMNKHPNYPHSLPLLLLHIYQHDGGIRGMYQGCTLQLLHVVLKSALLMMVRERIADATHRFFRIEE